MNQRTALQKAMALCPGREINTTSAVRSSGNNFMQITAQETSKGRADWITGFGVTWCDAMERFRQDTISTGVTR